LSTTAIVVTGTLAKYIDGWKYGLMAGGAMNLMTFGTVGMMSTYPRKHPKRPRLGVYDFHVIPKVISNETQM